MIVWFIGSIPMTIASLSAQGQQQAAQEPETTVMLLMASAIGLVVGLILSVAQWRVLRRYAAKAWQWLPANSITISIQNLP